MEEAFALWIKGDLLLTVFIILHLSAKLGNLIMIYMKWIMDFYLRHSRLLDVCELSISW